MNAPEVPAEQVAPEAAPAADAPPADAPLTAENVVRVLAQVPSSQVEAEKAKAEAEADADADDEPRFSVEDAVRVVVLLVRAHRTIGDADLDEALAVLDAEYPAPEATDVAPTGAQVAQASQDANAERAEQDESTAETSADETAEQAAQAEQDRQAAEAAPFGRSASGRPLDANEPAPPAQP